MIKNNIKCAVIGLGRMGGRHILALKKLNLKLVGVTDKSKKARINIKKKFHLSNSIVFKNVNQMLSNTNPRLLIIATTADSHASLVKTAAKYKIKKILVEKPMATSIDDCKKMILVCKKSKSQLTVNHPHKFMPEYISMKKIVNSKKFGGLKSFNFIGGNIGVSMNAIHMFERFRFFTNYPIIKISAWLSDKNLQNPRGKKFKEKAGQIKATNSLGQRFYLDISDDQGHRGLLVLAGKYGVLSIDLINGHSYLVFRKSKYKKFPTTRYSMPSEVKKFKVKTTDLITATSLHIKNFLKNKKVDRPESALNTIKVLVGAYKSNNLKGKEINLKNLNKKQKFPWA